MKLYEWEAKQLLASLGVRVPKGQLVKDRFEGKGRYVVKAQVLEGGRGKRGLVRVTDDPQSAIDEMRKLGIDCSSSRSTSRTTGRPTSPPSWIGRPASP